MKPSERCQQDCVGASPWVKGMLVVLVCCAGAAPEVHACACHREPKARNVKSSLNRQIPRTLGQPANATVRTRKPQLNRSQGNLQTNKGKSFKDRRKP